MEVCARLDLAPRLHASLAQRLATRLPHMSPQEKWEFYRAVCGEISACMGDVERGCWDFFDDPAIAKKQWEDWSRTLVNREGARKEPLRGDPYRGGEPRYMTFTIVMLLVKGSFSERALAQACEIPEPQLWLRSTFQRILYAIPSISFASVEGDVAYLLPRDPPYALTSGDLGTEQFNYLRPLL
jgi:hypothetical protein